MRRYDLDWLRVIVFGLLIFYHVGMFFVPWGFHIKNNVIYSGLIYPMLFLNQWRLPILFVISGMGTYFALRKRTTLQYIRERTVRLLLPLMVGMVLIIPPQVYIERKVEHQFEGSYFDFWPSHAFHGVYPEGNLSWHHLWFLPYLLLFSLVLAPLFSYLNKNPENQFLKWFNKQGGTRFGLFWCLVPLYLFESFLEQYFPVSHALKGDWFTLVNFLFLFFCGFALMAIRQVFWKTVETHRKSYLIFGLVGFSLLLWIKLGFEDSTVIHFTEALVKVFNLWSWILALFGYAAKYLDRPSKILSYSNEAVYPFYILHQTIIIILGYWLMHLQWGFLPKFALMVIGTFMCSWLLYEFGIRRWKIVRPLFGLKSNP